MREHQIHAIIIAGQFFFMQGGGGGGGGRAVQLKLSKNLYSEIKCC